MYASPVAGGDGREPEPVLGSPDRPVEKVSWDDVQRFWRGSTGTCPASIRCCPLEAQWEYACRAGTETAFKYGEAITPEQVNYRRQLSLVRAVRKVCTGKRRFPKPPPANPWGLYEMHGNVWEWCQDNWHDTYDGAPMDGGAWIEDTADPGPGRVLRGGSWFDRARLARSAYRDAILPGHRCGNLGFRCARVQES